MNNQYFCKTLRECKNVLVKFLVAGSEPTKNRDSTSLEYQETRTINRFLLKHQTLTKKYFLHDLCKYSFWLMCLFSEHESGGREGVREGVREAGRNWDEKEKSCDVDEVQCFPHIFWYWTPDLSALFSSPPLSSLLFSLILSPSSLSSPSSPSSPFLLFLFFFFSSFSSFSSFFSPPFPPFFSFSLPLSQSLPQVQHHILSKPHLRSCLLISDSKWWSEKSLLVFQEEG